MSAPITSPIAGAFSATFNALSAAAQVVNTTCSAANKLASAADSLAGWANESAKLFEEEAAFNRRLRMEELQRKITAHQSLVLPAQP